MTDWIALETLAEPDVGRERASWRPLRYFSFYRLALAGGLIGLDLLRLDPSYFGFYNPWLYQLTLWIYLLAAVASAVAVKLICRPIAVWREIILNICVAVRSAKKRFETGCGPQLITALTAAIDRQ